MNSLEMLFIVLGLMASLYIGYIILNQFVYLLAIVIHWWKIGVDMGIDYGHTYCVPRIIETPTPKKKRGHGFTKSLCKKARRKRSR